MSRRIEDYALIGNTWTAGLVCRDGSLDWLCVPRFDSPACFAALLGDRKNGRWLIGPRDKARRVTRAYRDGTTVLETSFHMARGRATLIDFIAPTRENGAIDVVRLVRGDSGRVDLRLEAIFRFDYGRIAPWVTRLPHGLYAIAGPDALELTAPVALEGHRMTTVAEFSVDAGQTVPFVLTWYPSHKRSPRHRNAAELLQKTEDWWQGWSANCKVGGKWRGAVHRSLVTLKALTYSPTGGIVAAATTSLPEKLGGVRNWDYRYCWLRDATFALYALMASNYGLEAQDWSRWLVRAAAGEPSKLQIMYGLSGERRLDEYEIPWLKGFGASAPVRVGNAAYTQRQMDIYGEVMDAFHSARLHDIDMGLETWQVQLKLMEFLEDHWREAEAGLWEMRGPEHRHTHSRVMAWVAFDRAIKSVERFGLKGPLDRWRRMRDVIHEDVCRRGFRPARNAFVQFYGADFLDASLLMMPLVGFLPARDPRIVGTVEAIQRELTVKGLVCRYQTDRSLDALPPGEGAFLACSFWMADALTMMGRRKEAERLFEKLLALRNDVGLLAEEYDPVGRRQLGNFPQAFSHVGLINTAQNLRQRHGPAERRART